MAVNDGCYTNNTLEEHYCQNNQIALVNYACPGLCSNGACVNTTVNQTCTDSDGGINYPVFGSTVVYVNGVVTMAVNDGCYTNNTLEEHYCQNNQIALVNYACPGLCSSGACVNNTNTTNSTICFDSDGGLNYNVAGKASNDTNYSRYKKDYCINLTYLSEAYCSNDAVLLQTVKCNNSCINNTCSSNFSEIVTCNLKENSFGWCYTTDGKYRCTNSDCGGWFNTCSFFPSCRVLVNEPIGTKLHWKSICAKNFSTTVDGIDEIIAFNCSNTTCGNGKVEGGEECDSSINCSGCLKTFCTDSDSGTNQFVYGTLNYGHKIDNRSIRLVDSCQSSSTLAEYYCDSSGNYASVIINCNTEMGSICESGRCTPMGQVHFTTTPSGAVVSIDGDSGDSFAQKTPTTRNLWEGKHAIILSKTNYSDYETNVSVVAGVKTSLTVTLNKSQGTLFMNSTPPSRIYIGGSYMGLTPKNISLYVGTYTIEFSAFGFPNYYFQKTILSGQNAKVIVTIPRQ